MLGQVGNVAANNDMQQQQRSRCVENDARLVENRPNKLLRQSERSSSRQVGVDHLQVTEVATCIATVVSCLVAWERLLAQGRVVHRGGWHTRSRALL